MVSIYIKQFIDEYEKELSKHTFMYLPNGEKAPDIALLHLLKFKHSIMLNKELQKHIKTSQFKEIDLIMINLLKIATVYYEVYFKLSR